MMFTLKPNICKPWLQFKLAQTIIVCWR